jgi:hypothetical protein
LIFQQVVAWLNLGAGHATNGDLIVEILIKITLLDESPGHDALASSQVQAVDAGGAAVGMWLFGSDDRVGR